MDEYSRHEVLHVSDMIGEIIETHLCEHEAIRSNEKWYELASEAASIMAILYQKIGEEHFNDADNPPIEKE